MERWFFTCIFCLLVDEQDRPVTGDEDDIFASDAVSGRYQSKEELVNRGVLDRFTELPELERGERIRFEVYTYEYLGEKTTTQDVMNKLKGDEFLSLTATGQLVPLENYTVYAVITS